MNAHFGYKDGRHDILQIPLADILEDMHEIDRHDLLMMLAMDKELVVVLCHAVAGTRTDQGLNFNDATVQACRVAVAPMVGEEVAKGFKDAVETIERMKQEKAEQNRLTFDLQESVKTLKQQNQELRQLNRLLQDRLENYQSDKGADA